MNQMSDWEMYGFYPLRGRYFVEFSISINRGNYRIKE